MEHKDTEPVLDRDELGFIDLEAARRSIAQLLASLDALLELAREIEAALTDKGA